MYMGVAHQDSSNPQLGDTALHTNVASCNNRALLIVTLWGGNGNMEIGPCIMLLGGWQFHEMG